MLEDEVISCPVCDKDLHVKVSRIGHLAKDTTYYVTEECKNCNTAANKLERMLNFRPSIKSGKSYIKSKSPFK